MAMDELIERESATEHALRNGRRPRAALDWGDRTLGLGLALLGSRSLVWAAAGAGGVVWTLAVLHPEPWRLLAATGYCLTVLVPVIVRDVMGG